MKSNDSKLKKNEEEFQSNYASNSEQITAAHIEAVMPRRVKKFSIFRKPNSRLKYLGWFKSMALTMMVLWDFIVIPWIGGVICFILRLVGVFQDDSVNNSLYISGCALLGVYALFWIINCIFAIFAIKKAKKYTEYYDISIGKKAKIYFILSIFLPMILLWLIIKSIDNYAERHIPSIYDLLDFERLEPIVKHDGDKVIYICPICNEIMDESGLTDEIGDSEEHLHQHVIENKDIDNVYEEELSDEYLINDDLVIEEQPINEEAEEVKVEEFIEEAKVEPINEEPKEVKVEQLINNEKKTNESENLAEPIVINDDSNEVISIPKSLKTGKRTLTKTIVKTTTITYESANAPKDMNDCGTEISRTTKIEEILADGDEVIGTTISLGDQIDQQNIIVSDFKGESTKKFEVEPILNEETTEEIDSDEEVFEEDEEKQSFFSKLFGKKNHEDEFETEGKVEEVEEVIVKPEEIDSDEEVVEEVEEKQSFWSKLFGKKNHEDETETEEEVEEVFVKPEEIDSDEEVVEEVEQKQSFWSKLFGKKNHEDESVEEENI